MSSAVSFHRRYTLFAFVAGGLLALAMLGAGRASAAAGELDPTFGTAGTVRIYEASYDFELNAIAAQPDGKVILAGAEGEDLLVRRLLANGAPDPSFGTGGIVLEKLPDPYADAQAAAVQADGKIVVAGGVGETEDDVFVARFDPNGAPDPTFGGKGFEIVPVGAKSNRAEALAIGAGGRILVAGESGEGGGSAIVLALRENGEPDPTFSGDGIEVLEAKALPPSGEGVGIVEQPDRQIVVADNAGTGGGDGFVLVRLLSGGGLDPSFGGDGIVVTPIPGSSTGGRVNGIALQPDGRIIAAGYGYDEPVPEGSRDSKYAAARYLPDGELDPSFASAGIYGAYQFDHFKGSDEQANSVDVAPNGKVVLGGYFQSEEGVGSFGILRLDAAGILDPTFGIVGAARSPLAPSTPDDFVAGTLDAQGRYLALSQVEEEKGAHYGAAITRFLGDPPPVPPTPPAVPPPAAALGRAPHARIKAISPKIAAAKLKGFSGSAADADGGTIASVQIALERVVRNSGAGKLVGGNNSKQCSQLKNARARFKTVKAKRGEACPLRWLSAKGTTAWSYKLKKPLPPGRYTVYARALGADGATESSFSKTAGDRLAFRVVK